MNYIYTVLMLFFLAGCATPQEKAIFAHCNAEAFKMIPQQLVTQQVMRPFFIGEKIIGNRNVCRTNIRDSKDRRGNITKIRETICMDEPITEPVFQQQLVSETVDINISQRQVQINSCSLNAKAIGMFSNIK